MFDNVCNSPKEFNYNSYIKKVLAITSMFLAFFYKKIYQGHMLAFFTIVASSVRHPPVYSLHLKGGPKKDKLRSIENTSYKGYSPPKCTCNVHSTFHTHIPTSTCQFYIEFYMSCHERRHDSSCTVRTSPNRLPHTTPKPICEKPSSWMTSNDHFQNKIICL